MHFLRAQNIMWYLGMEAHTYNPSTWEAKTGGSCDLDQTKQ